MSLSEYTIASQEEIAKATQISTGVTLGGIGAGILTGSPGGVNRTLVFKVMWDNFGPPNGHSFDDEKQTWEWVLKTDKGLLTVYDYKGTWSIGFLQASNTIQESFGKVEELTEYATALKDAVLQETKNIKVSRKQIKESKIGGIISNPYSLFNNTSIQLLDQAAGIIREIHKKERTGKALAGLHQEWEQGPCVAALFRASIISSYLSFEGFVNVIYAIFLKDRYRNDLFERDLQNKMIPAKLLEMDKYCDEFVTQVVSPEDELFKAFQHFTNVRNDFLHANIVRGMEAHLVRTGDHEILWEEKAEEKFGITTHPGRITNADVIRSQRLVQKLIVRIINSMSKRIRRKFAIVHSYWELKYYFNSKGQVDFPLDAGDIIPNEEIEKMLALSATLDTEYYEIGDELYIPKGLPY